MNKKKSRFVIRLPRGSAATLRGFIRFLALCVFVLLILGFGESARAATTTVCESGCDETTIQSAFDNHNLEPGDIVEIRDSRTYSGSPITWGSDDVGDNTARVILQAQSGQSPIIAGRIWIPNGRDYVQIGGEESDGRITIDPVATSWIDGAINIQSNHNVVQYTIIQDVYDGNGIFLWGGGTHNIIQHNTLNNIGTLRFVYPGSQGDAIIVYVDQANANHIIQNNYIGNTAHTGIIIYSGCSYIKILNNTVNNPYGNGIGVQRSSYVLIGGNTIYNTGTQFNWENKRSLQLTGSDHCTIRRNIVYNAYNEAMEAYSYNPGQIQDHIFVYNNIFHTTGWAGIMFGSWISGGYATNTPVINNIFYNIAVRGDQMVNPSKNAVTHIYGGSCNPDDDLGDSDATLQTNNLKDSNFQNNCVILNDEGTMSRYALYYLNAGGSYRLMKTILEINEFDDSTTGNIEDDPSFAGTPSSTNWWHIQSDSPCRDAGIVVDDTNAAIGGWEQLTYSGSAPDIGAYEYISTDNPPTRSNPQPTGTLSSGTTSTTISLDTDETATCKYSTAANTAYDDMSNIFATTNSTNHSTNITNLVDGNSYTYYIRCQDESGNANNDDFEISFSVASSTTYSLSNFINLVTDWLKTESGLESDVNGDGVVNTRDLGIMMSNWQ